MADMMSLDRKDFQKFLESLKVSHGHLQGCHFIVVFEAMAWLETACENIKITACAKSSHYEEVDDSLLQDICFRESLRQVDYLVHNVAVLQVRDASVIAAFGEESMNQIEKALGSGQPVGRLPDDLATERQTASQDEAVRNLVKDMQDSGMEERVVKLFEKVNPCSTLASEESALHVSCLLLNS